MNNKLTLNLGWCHIDAKAKEETIKVRTYDNILRMRNQWKHKQRKNQGCCPNDEKTEGTKSQPRQNLGQCPNDEKSQEQTITFS